ncbi:MAG: MarR family transcriptional regulator [Candidatus Cloacimonetes bacterium]|nr:MarR family transcriptional regulator [Candidatus Cloacimonadota bacterium]
MKQKEDETDLGNRLYKITTQINVALSKYEESTKKDYKLGRVESHLLHLLAVERKALPMKDIAKALGVSQSRVTHLIDTLLAKGYLERFSSPDDRRIFLAQITPAGIDVNTNYKEDIINRYHNMLQLLSDVEKNKIFESFKEWKNFLYERSKEFNFEVEES